MRPTFGMVAAAALAGGVLAAPVPKDEKPLPPPTAADFRQSANNLKQIVLAFHNHESAYGHFPNNSAGKDGKPLLSWRVHILPFLEEDQLWKQFKLDEAWDSPANKPLAEKMPKVYAPVRVKAEAGQTFYRGFAGAGAPFQPGKKLRIRDFVDGTSGTGLVFEAKEPVLWTKPDDLPFDPAKPLPGLGGLFDGEGHVALADGSVRRLRPDADPDVLKALIGYQDGIPLKDEKLYK